MMKSVVIIVALTSLQFLHAQTGKEEIKWSFQRKLKISDFHSKPDTLSKHSATSYLYRPYKSYIKNDTLHLKIYNVFSPAESWFKKSNTDSARNKKLLLHEQGHFDLSEIQVRKTKKYLLDNSIKINKGNYKQLILQQLQLQEQLFNEVSKKYDTETNFSLNEKKQGEWNQKISKELKDLDNLWGDYIFIVLAPKK